ncbi:MAG: glutamate synthase large subunit [Deltaproteobacteria bacterium]|nr:glutamate synthase large subunit [Deltaproteobacteria bacterium]
MAERDGLYRPDLEHDACGVGFVANIDGRRTREVLDRAITVLTRLEHRGATGSDPTTGDGAGVLLQLPHAFLARAADTAGFVLPELGRYAAGLVFLPTRPELRDACLAATEHVVRDEGLELLGWREVPTDERFAGEVARSCMPVIRQLFVSAPEGMDPATFERRLFVARKRIGRTVRDRALARDETFYVCSLSSRTIVYKGMLRAEQLPRFFEDLRQDDVRTALALVHQRYSTNTFPSWQRAHPYRYIAHNGEINTLRGNQNWMHAREKMMSSPLFGDDIAKLVPVIDPMGSDSAMFDNVLELLVHTGRSLPHAMMMMVPEAWQKHESMSDKKKAFYEYHACLMEPWDGPAAIAFTDGRVIGALLDRNGLRPSRYVVTEDGTVVMASEAGVLDIPADQIRTKNRLQSGRLFLVDTEAGRIVDDDELKESIAGRRHYRAWLRQHAFRINELPAPSPDRLPRPLDARERRTRQLVHGYTLEDQRMLMAPMAINGQEAVGSMGNDAPLAVLSEKPQPLFHYFRQLFAQVTNPPIDPIREELVMTSRTTLGAEQNLFDETPLHCHRIALDAPIIDGKAMMQIKDIAAGRLRSTILPILYRLEDGGAGLRAALDHLCAWASAAVADGATLLVLSDRGANREWAPIPSLLAVGAVHHQLTRECARTRCSLVVESGEPREVMHFCLLLGYGASAVHPFLACETVADMAARGTLGDRAPDDAVAHYLKAANKGILKVMSKMGISTLQGYRGAQIFEAIGLDPKLVDRHFAGTPSRLGGLGIDEIARESALRHERAYRALPTLGDDLDAGGQYQWRRDGETHLYDPETVPALQHAVRAGSYAQFKRFSALANAESRKRSTLRGLLRFKTVSNPVPLEEVEPASEIVKRFKTGAMSLGSISREAHETLAIAMNRLGGKSNTGEGGEDRARYVRDANGDSRRSAIKQVASGRFGVTIEYLVQADELQIKMAQGAKPGEGGQLPGHKVDPYIASIRCSTPGVGLISPPPHHDIYSIEDLAQLIHDLKRANDQARISVKLVSEVGVGTIAAGVAKAGADVVVISGDSGGTGAAPLTSIKHAGVPWELGLAEAQQVLLINGLRDRIRVETDGQLKTGRDAAIAILLGAEELGFATAALVAVGCVMMRVCHLNTCPVGVATQDPELRRRFAGKPEHVMHFMTFVAEELREIMASLGLRTVDEMVGRADLLEPDPDVMHWKARTLDLGAILHRPVVEGVAPRMTRSIPRPEPTPLEQAMIAMAEPALERAEHVRMDLRIRNVDRTACTHLSSAIARRYGNDGLPPGTIDIRLEGSAGQSFAAFLARGLDVTLEGEANDYFAKGMSGGRVVVKPPRGAHYVPEENILVGNVALYGATGGEVFLHGQAGERFAVRNSGATAVVEGVGDHGCEYMTRGTVLVLGPTGRNFAAGMSGGIAFVLDTAGTIDRQTNHATVALEDPSEEDLLAVRALVHRHWELTNSGLAWRVLSGWRLTSRRIAKVMPIDYKRVLDSMHLVGDAARLATV